MRKPLISLWRLVAVILSVALVAASCGADDAATEADEDAAESTGEAVDDSMEDEDAVEDEDATEDEDVMEDGSGSGVISDECPIPNPAETVEIDAMGWEFPIITAYGDELEECAEGNYSFNLQFLDSTEARNAMTQDAATGSPTFELYQGSNAFITELANQGFLTPLNDLVEKYSDEYDLDAIDPAFWDLASLDGNIYAVPMVSNTMHLFYNEPVLTELGVDVPTNFEEAFAACEALKSGGYDVGFMFMLSADWSWQIEFDSVLGALGELPIDPDTGAPNFNTPEGIEAATILKDMWEQCGGAAAGTYSTDDIQAAFQTGEVVLGHTWASRAAAMDDPEASTVVGEMQFAPALSAGGDTLAAPAFIDGWGIPAGTPEELIEPIFLAMLAATDAESQEAAAEFGLVTRSGATNPAGPRDGEAAAVSLVDGRGADLTHPAAGIARAKLGEALVTILDGTSVEDALASAEDAYLTEAGDQGLLDS